MSREHAYAYEAGYRDGSINYELEHCPACKNVADLQEALTENAKLRDERREYQATIDSLVDECADHKAENDRLRELISGLEHCCQGFACDCCPLYDPSGTNHRRCESLERELGIEVDE